MSYLQRILNDCGVEFDRRKRERKGQEEREGRKERERKRGREKRKKETKKEGMTKLHSCEAQCVILYWNL